MLLVCDAWHLTKKRKEEPGSPIGKITDFEIVPQVAVGSDIEVSVLSLRITFPALPSFFVRCQASHQEHR